MPTFRGYIGAVAVTLAVAWLVRSAVLAAIIFAPGIFGVPQPDLFSAVLGAAVGLYAGWWTYGPIGVRDRMGDYGVIDL